MHVVTAVVRHVHHEIVFVVGGQPRLQVSDHASFDVASSGRIHGLVEGTGGASPTGGHLRWFVSDLDDHAGAVGPSPGLAVRRSVGSHVKRNGLEDGAVDQISDEDEFVSIGDGDQRGRAAFDQGRPPTIPLCVFERQGHGEEKIAVTSELLPRSRTEVFRRYYGDT